MADDEAVTEVVGAMTQLSDQLEPVVELVVGHKRRLEGEGFSLQVAEMMALQLYQHLICKIFA